MNPDPTAPTGGFRFINNTPSGAAVVYRKVQGAFSPIYINKNAPRSPRTEVLFPVAKCAVWFGPPQYAQAGIMSSSLPADCLEVDLTGKASAAVEYGDEGPWSMSSGGEEGAWIRGN